MKILFDSYDNCCQNKSGGVQIRMKKIFALLKEKKIDVKFFDKFADNIEDYDIVHLFKLEYQKYPMIECAKNKNKKIVLSTIMSTKIGWKKHIQKIISKLPFLSIYKINLKILNLSDALICETPDEKNYIARNYNINPNKIHVIANGVEKIEYNGTEIFKKIGGQQKYVLQVGRFDPNKNQLNVIKALKNTDINIIFIGGEDFTNKDYYSKCLAEAKNCKNIHFLGWLDKEDPLLKSAFKNADTVILPSFYETFPKMPVLLKMLWHFLRLFRALARTHSRLSLHIRR